VRINLLAELTDTCLIDSTNTIKTIGEKYDNCGKEDESLQTHPSLTQTIRLKKKSRKTGSIRSPKENLN